MIATALSNIIPGLHATAPGPESNFWYHPVGSASSAGIAVKPDNAMAVSAVFACVRLLAESLGSLPWRVYKRNGDRKELAQDYYLWKTLHDRPNSWQTPIEWREMGMAHLALRGNFYNQIVINDLGETELIPMNPDHVKVRMQPNRRVQYQWQRAVGDSVILDQSQVFHVRGMSTDGLVGISVLEFARNAIGSAIAQETHGASLFKNGGLPTFWISRPAERKFTQQARDNFRAGWRKLHGGPENAGSPPILEDDMALHELGLSNRDSQWIESQSFSGLQICRFFRVAPHLVGFLDRATFSNIEQQSIEFVTYTLAPWAVRWEQSAERDLFDDPAYYSKLAVEALLRGDMTSRYTSYNIGVQGGWLTRNEVRELEDMNPIEGGDIALEPLNMQPAGGGPDQNEQGGQPGKGKPKQNPADEDEPTAYEKRKQKKKAAEASFSVLLDEAAARMAATEIHGMGTRAAKASEDREKWNQWAIGFYAKHQAYIIKTLDPICAAWLEATGEKCDPNTLAALVVAPIGPIFDADTDIPGLLERWKLTRTTELATTLKERFFDETL